MGNGHRDARVHEPDSDRNQRRHHVVHAELPDGGDWSKAGWYILAPGQNKQVFDGDLHDINRNWLFFAEDLEGRIWAGPYVRAVPRQLSTGANGLPVLRRAMWASDSKTSATTTTSQSTSVGAEATNASRQGGISPGGFSVSQGYRVVGDEGCQRGAVGQVQPGAGPVDVALDGPDRDV
jgi:hypothetical protein